MRQPKKAHTCPDCGKPTSKYQLKQYGRCHECAGRPGNAADPETTAQEATEKGGA